MIEFIVVLVVGDGGGDCCAYAGRGTDEFVRDRGDKLSLRMACGHFPNLETDLKRLKLTYRDDGL